MAKKKYTKEDLSELLEKPGISYYEAVQMVDFNNITDEEISKLWLRLKILFEECDGVTEKLDNLL